MENDGLLDDSDDEFTNTGPPGDSPATIIFTLCDMPY